MPDSARPVERDYTASIYGALLVTTLLAAEWRFAASVAAIEISLIASVAVFWVAHSWAAIVNERMRGRVTWSRAAMLARAEAPMLGAVILPTIALSATAVGVPVDDAVRFALILSIVQLFLWGLVVGRQAHTAWLTAAAVAMIDCMLGITIALVEVAVLH